MTKKAKKTALLLITFLGSFSIALRYEGEYRKLVRSFFKYFQEGHIQFFGKPFHLFATWYFILAFSSFCTLLIMFTYKASIRTRLLIFTTAVVLFFLSSFTTSYIHSAQIVAACTDCRNGVSFIHFNAINYDFHFIIALFIALLPGLFFFLKRFAYLANRSS